MRYIGIDPGYALVGWAIVDFEDNQDIKLCDYGVITTDKGNTPENRLSEIYKDMKDIIEKYSPEIAGLETLLFLRNVTTAMKVSEARGVIILSLNDCGIKILNITPLQVKSSISGYGRASKTQIQENVKIICGLDEIPKPDDAADAIAVAIAAHDINYCQKISQ